MLCSVIPDINIDYFVLSDITLDRLGRVAGESRYGGEGKRPCDCYDAPPAPGLDAWSGTSWRQRQGGRHPPPRSLPSSVSLECREPPPPFVAGMRGAIQAMSK